MSENYSPTTPPMSKESHLENLICMQSRHHLTTDHKNWEIVLSVDRKCVQTSALYSYFHVHNRGLQTYQCAKQFHISILRALSCYNSVARWVIFRNFSLCADFGSYIWHESGAHSEEESAKHVHAFLCSISQRELNITPKDLRGLWSANNSDSAENIRFVHCPEATRHHIGRARACFKSFTINRFYSVNIEWIITRNVYKVVSAR